MPIDRLAVDGLHVIGKEGGDVLVSRPVERHAEVVTVLGLEFFLQLRLSEEVGPEPVKIGKLLIGQLVKLLVRTGGEAGSNEVLQIKSRIGELLASAFHVVRQSQNLAVAVVCTDQVRVRNPAVINRLAGLHGGLQFFNHVAFLNQVMLDLDACDLFKRLGQRLGLVLMRGESLRDHGYFVDAFGFQLSRCIDEPFHLSGLLVFRQRGRLELVIYPFFCRLRNRNGRSHRGRGCHCRCRCCGGGYRLILLAAGRHHQNHRAYSR